jgi:cysteine desulfurase / selenocysteine lyase
MVPKQRRTCESTFKRWMLIFMASPDIRCSDRPVLSGGMIRRSVTCEKTTYLDPPFKFEGGTPNIAGAIGLSAALDYVEK